MAEAEKRRNLVLSALEPLIITPESVFVNIGERTNVTQLYEVFFKKMKVY